MSNEDKPEIVRLSGQKSPQESFSRKERLMRPHMLELYREGDEKLSALKVGMIGAGGLGGLCALLLGGAGVGTLRLADGDQVAVHNLHRQLLFNEQDVGQSKALAAQREVKARNSGLEVQAFNCMIDESNFTTFAHDLDFIMDLSDNAQSRLRISKLCLESKIPLISAAVSGYTALIAIFAYDNDAFVKEHGCYACLTNHQDINTKVGITGPQAASASSLTAHIALEYALGCRDLWGKLLVYDLKSLKIHHFNLKPNPHCLHCRSAAA